MSCKVKKIYHPDSDWTLADNEWVVDQKFKKISPLAKFIAFSIARIFFEFY